MEDSSKTFFAHADYRCSAFLNGSCSEDVPLNGSDLSVFLFMLVMSVLTVCGNMVVIISIVVFQQLRTPTNFIILSLAVSDFLIGAIMMPLQCVLLVDTCLHHGKTLCPVYSFISMIVGTVSLYNVVLIAADRYFALCNPFGYAAKMTVRTTSVCISFGWCFSFCYNLIMMYVGSSERGEGNVICFRECAIPVSNTWGLIDLIFIFIVPCLSIILLYLRVLRVALKHAKAISNTVKLTASQQRKKSELKATKTLGSVVLVYLMCWIPWYTCLVNIESLPNPSVSITYLMCLFFSNSCINPVIYAISFPWFRKSVRIFALH
ncbi:trace amine-associated receptor 13c-like [Pygocentrus nattereri]|uniref:trace amine-associated receptor 13c-like n=1 Tax=Pygocentrus nattereri TaxID=42514 RepID=UPI00081425A7|nr:trace amine-associated receptor 13c-like [Pygocentrus nattereri]